MRDRARLPEPPAPLAPAPDRHPDGPGLQARSAQRIEQVARQGSHIASMIVDCPKKSHYCAACRLRDSNALTDFDLVFGALYFFKSSFPLIECDDGIGQSNKYEGARIADAPSKPIV